MKIVLGGSRFLEFIPLEISNRLHEWMNLQAEFAVGDAPGIDKAFQLILKVNAYNSVQIFSSAESVRNNLGNWPVKIVESGLKTKSSAVHAFKDRKMCELADIGMMIWDGISAGTLSNVIDLTNQGKKCLVWVAPESDFYQFDSPASLSKWMDGYPAVCTEAQKRLKTFYKREAKRVIENSQPELFG